MIFSNHVTLRMRLKWRQWLQAYRQVRGVSRLLCGEDWPRVRCMVRGWACAVSPSELKWKIGVKSNTVAISALNAACGKGDQMGWGSVGRAPRRVLRSRREFTALVGLRSTAELSGHETGQRKF